MHDLSRRQFVRLGATAVAAAAATLPGADPELLSGAVAEDLIIEVDDELLRRALHALGLEGPANVAAGGRGLAADSPHRRPRRPTVLGLDEFASLVGCEVGTTTVADENHLPFAQDDIRAIDAFGEQMNRYLETGDLPADASAVLEALRREVFEPVPEMEVVAEHPATAGFPVGSRRPWCGRSEGRFTQRWLQGFKEGGRYRVLARSGLNGKPLIVADEESPLLAYDLTMPSEPRIEWHDRGGFNKYRPLLSFLGRPPVHGARHWNNKPTYAEFAEEVRRVWARVTDWRLDTIGRRGDDPIYALTLGDPVKPLYTVVGMLHAEDEWVPSLGALSFVEHLGGCWNEPAWRGFFDRFAVKVFPLQLPAVYESPRFRPKEDRPRDRIDAGALANDRIHATLQLHQGGQCFVAACGTPVELARRMAEDAKRRGRGVLVRDGKPEPFEAPLTGEVAPPSWDLAYYVHQFYRLYPPEQTMAARALLLAEFPMIGFMPERLTQSARHHQIHRGLFGGPTHYTLAQTEQVVNWCLAFLRTPTDGLERPSDWQPPPKA